MSGQEYYDPETGELLGWVHETPDGGAVLIDEDGVILEAETPDGNPADPSFYDGVEIADDTPDDPGYGDRLDALEQRMNEPRFDPRQEGREHVQRINEEAATARFNRELEGYERDVLGRPASDRERHVIADEYAGDVVAGIEPSVWSAAAALPYVEPGTHEARMQRAMDSIGDAEREQTGEDYDPDSKPWHEPASSNPSDVRVARAMNFVDHGVSSADQAADDAEFNDSYEED